MTTAQELTFETPLPVLEELAAKVISDIGDLRMRVERRRRRLSGDVDGGTRLAIEPLKNLLHALA